MSGVEGVIVTAVCSCCITRRVTFHVQGVIYMWARLFIAQTALEYEILELQMQALRRLELTSSCHIPACGT
jgi:hypothetical protein